MSRSPASSARAPALDRRPVDRAATLADALRATEAHVSLHEAESDHGQDATLLEPEAVGPPIADSSAEGWIPVTDSAGEPRETDDAID